MVGLQSVSSSTLRQIKINCDNNISIKIHINSILYSLSNNSHFKSLSQKTKVLFTNHCRWQNFRPSLLRLVNNYVESIYKTQKTRTKVLPSATKTNFSNQQIRFV